jgi:hypothetical protein
MDQIKCDALKSELEVLPEPQVISLARFFDGNDDAASIGCNLPEHPGVEAFRDILAGLLRRSDVEALYALISELDPGDDCWPFTDTILVVGTIAPDDLRDAVESLHPDEVGPAEYLGVPASVLPGQTSPVLAIWWD